jgi:CheY-specific phosphatase CheX
MTTAATSYKELERKYGLEPLPDSVLRLTQLVARQDSDLDEIGKVISQDQALTKRLLRAANPRAKTEEDYVATTVEEALMRTGVGCVLLLAMGTPLTVALHKTFQTMLGLKLESINPKSVETPAGEHVSCKIGFSGKSVGEVHLRLSADCARRVAAGILGLKPEELTDPAEVNDTMGELLNICTGNFKSNLCDAGLDCKLQPPKVSRSREFTTETLPGGGLERMAFQAANILLFVDVSVNPWNE